MTLGDFERVANELIRVKEENEELKKQLEDYIKTNLKLKNELFNKRKEYQDTYKDVRIEIKEYKTQQKEFINYLEDEIKIYSNTYMGEMLKELKEVLQKYKSIIGNDINVGSKGGNKDE